MTPTSTLVNKVWSFCHVLRDAGLSYGDYLEQLTYLIFLKMAHEYRQPPYNRNLGIPEGYDWPSLTSKTGAELESHYVHLLRKLGQEKGLLGQIFMKAQNHIQEPALLASLIYMIDQEQWLVMGGRRQGRYLRGVARTERPGHQERCRAVLHSAPTHQSDGRMRPPRAGQDHLRPGLRNGRLLPGGIRLHHQSGQLSA